MARPLPRDIEEQTGLAARRGEVRSVGLFCFIVGIAFGFGISAAISADVRAGYSGYAFTGLMVLIAIYVVLASRKPKKND